MTISQENLQNPSYTNTQQNKTYKHKHQTQIFEELVPSILPLLKEHINLGHAGIVDNSVEVIDTVLNKI